jgi:hypothetical protein
MEVNDMYFLLVLPTRITGKVPIKRSLPAENAQFPEIDLFFAAFWIFLVAAIKDG